MTVGFSLLTANSAENNATSYNTASVSPTDEVVLVAVSTFESSTNQPDISSVSGLGLTWTEVGSVLHDSTGGDRGTTFLWVGKGTPSTGAVTISFTSSVRRCAWIVTDVTGADSGAGTIVQAYTNSTNQSGSSATGTLSAFADATNNGSFLCVGIQVSGTTDIGTPEAGWTELAEANQSYGRIAAAYKVGEDTSPSYSWTGSGKYGIIAVEIAAAAVGTEYTVDHSDSVALTDSYTNALTIGRELLDTVAITDTDFARAWAHKPEFTDPVAISEMIYKLRGHTKTDNVDITDLLGFQYPRGPEDTMGITDEVIIQLSKGVTPTDTVAITDSVEFDYGKGVTDTVMLSDTVEFIKNMERVFEESVGLTEEVSVVLPNAAAYVDTVYITDSATVQLILNTLKPDSLSIVDDRRIVVQEFFSMGDDEVKVMTIGDLAYKYWSYLSQLTPVERQSLYDHFKRYAPDGKNWIEDITEQP